MSARWHGFFSSSLVAAVCILILAACGANARVLTTGDGGAHQRSLLAAATLKLEPDNPTCGPGFISYKIDFAPSPNTEYGGLVRIGNTDGYHLDFSLLASQIGKVSLTKVIVKGGTDANVYYYPSEITGDNGLVTPTNPKNGGPFGISHVDFCYKLKLDLQVSTTTTFTRTYLWDVTKTATPTTGSAKAGQTTDYNWVISVPAPTFVDSDHALGCTIVVINPSNQPLPGFSASCGVGGGGGRRLLTTPSCTLSSIPAGGSSTCTTTVAIPESLSISGGPPSSPPGGTVTASVVPTSLIFAPASASANYAFGNPTTVVGGTATLADALTGFPKTLSTDDFKGANKDGISYTVAASATCSSNPADYTDGSYSGTASNTATLTDSAGNVDTATATYSYTCTVWELTSSIDVSAAFARTWTWAVTKSVNVTSQEGQASDKLYWGWTITATPSYTDIGTVSCKLTITNPSPFAVVPTVTRGAAAVTCAAASLAAGATTTCDCSFDTSTIADGAVSVSIAVDWDTVAFKKAAVVKSASYSFGTTPASQTDLDVTLVDSRAVPPLNKALTATAVTTGYSTSYGDSHVCNPSKTAYGTSLSYSETVTNTAVVKSSKGVSLATATATTTVTCKIAELLLQKTLSGAVSTAQVWTFMMVEGTYDANTVTTTAAPAATNAQGFISSFSGANAALRADKKYTVCEQMNAGWGNDWQWKDGSAMTPFFPPNTDVRCVEVGAGTTFPLVAGSSHTVTVNNVPSGGIPLSPGYWANWNRCSGGKQADAALKNGGCAAGFCLIEDLIAGGSAGNSITWDAILTDSLTVPIDTCIKAVATLQGKQWTSPASLNGKVLMSDPARKLARQLLAAQLNFAAGACKPANVQTAINNALLLLDQANFNGVNSGAYITKTVPSATAMAQADAAHAVLAAYNNHNCNP